MVPFGRKPSVFPVYSVPNPIDPRGQSGLGDTLRYPLTGDVPESPTGTETDQGLYVLPSRTSFTLDLDLAFIAVQPTPQSLVVFWGGIDQPGVRQARSYTIRAERDHPAAMPLTFESSYALLVPEAVPADTRPWTILQTMTLLGVHENNADLVVDALGHFRFEGDR